LAEVIEVHALHTTTPGTTVSHRTTVGASAKGHDDHSTVAVSPVAADPGSSMVLPSNQQLTPGFRSSNMETTGSATTSTHQRRPSTEKKVHMQNVKNRTAQDDSSISKIQSLESFSGAQENSNKIFAQGAAPAIMQALATEVPVPVASGSGAKRAAIGSPVGLTGVFGAALRDIKKIKDI
jgi:hypothetical protein